MPYFEELFPDDPRPRRAIETLQAWLETGVFRMAVIREASLASHAAARAAGQALATAHVPMHAIGAAMYALQAIHRAADQSDADAAVASERAWQRRLLESTG